MRAALLGVFAGAVLALAAANVWPLLLITLGLGPAVIAEVAFLGVLLMWASGRGAPTRWRSARADMFRRIPSTPRAWAWVTVAAVGFAVAVHAAMVLLFRLVEFPEDAFRAAYRFPPVSGAAAWALFVVSALSAGVCEEIGFRGWMQRPLEQRVGPAGAIAVSTVLFTLVHLNQAWATPGMLPLVAGAGVILGMLAWRTDSLAPGIAGHVMMDIGMFAYWWSGYLGEFTLRPVGETGMDAAFMAAAAVLVVAAAVLAIAQARVRQSIVSP